MKAGSKSYAIPNSSRPGESQVLRNNANKDSLDLKTFPNVNTAYDIFWNSVRTHPDSQFLGHREHDPATNSYGNYVFSTYAQTAERVENLASGLVHINQKANHASAESNIMRQFPVAIYSTNCPEWAITERAAFTQSLYTVSLYDTLGESSVEYIINHSETPMIVCSIDKIAKLLRLADSIPNVKNIVSIQSFSGENGFPKPFNTTAVTVLKEWAAHKNIGLYDMETVEKMGAQAPLKHCPPSPSDIYTICYTSGTTGNPKGALSTHSAYTIAAKSSSETLSLVDTQCYISYLPLAHCYGRNLENFITLIGGSIGYFQGDITKIVEDCQALQPTLFASVPRLLNRLYDAMTAASVNATGLKGMIARKAVSDKLANLKAGKGNLHSVWDFLLFNKMRAVISRKLQLVNTGSAPLEGNVLEFLRIGFACVVTEGFGMTETSSISLIQSKTENTSGNIGAPFLGVEVKLIDVKEMNYLVSDHPNPRGELCVRGKHLFSGYLKDEEKTKESFMEDGWFMTGDIARINSDGTVSIIDRKKNIFKLSQGEYIAPEKIENILQKHPLVMQAFVHGDSFRNHLVAVIVPDKETFIPWAKKVLGQVANGLSLKELCSDPAINKALLKELDQAGTASKLQGFEKVKAIYLEPNEFDIEVNQLLTPTLKLKRTEAAKKYADIITQLYQSR
ncbi:Long chain acyl-CoA synthetase 7, peroxisomal [Smittium mucronatum]|uniref:Long chain acyl-CoA synthetase 7, peroxisomal n=1 Tax=Smittium mucronatum TaxID=133383 RepID=A0A1R0H1F7_9FUNG|nr:Long chain acyl-CoA synthetase 7, peroxisomal [Smittium mucronatum]